MVFTDLEKAYDIVPKEVMWWAFKMKHILCKYIKVIVDMYIGALTNARITKGYHRY